MPLPCPGAPRGPPAGRLTERSPGRKGHNVKQRILYVSVSSWRGGAEHSLLELMRGLDRCRFEPLAVLPGPGPLAELLRAAGAEVFFAPMPELRREPNPFLLGTTALRIAETALLLAAEARRRGASLLHANTTAAQVLAGPAGALAHLPVIWHVRDLQELSLLGQALARLSAGRIAVSRAVRERLVRSTGVKLRVEVIPNGIDADAFVRQARPGRLRTQLGLAAGQPLVLMVGQMVPWKGHNILLGALSRLRSSFPGLHAAVAGSDVRGMQERYGRSLRELTDALGLREMVHWLGFRDDVPSLLADCDLVVIPSRAEPFGRIALEAMAMERPVVGTAAGGLPEVVADGETGLLVPCDDSQALAEAVRRLLLDRRLGRRMGRAGAARVRMLFSIEEHVSRVQELYSRILER